MPTYANHEKFVLLKPYKEWFIIYDGMMRVGSIYISKTDEIGLFILNEHHNKGYGGESLKTIIKEYPDCIFKANINPNNYKSINFFKKHGFLWQTIDIMEGQITYIKL
jgi:RimJ/RimL family protein N-acetyltransferase